MMHNLWPATGNVENILIYKNNPYCKNAVEYILTCQCYRKTIIFGYVGSYYVLTSRAFSNWIEWILAPSPSRVITVWPSTIDYRVLVQDMHCLPRPELDALTDRYNVTLLYYKHRYTRKLSKWTCILNIFASFNKRNILSL